MPVYNSRDYLADAVQSVLDQDYHDFELVLVDDGSTDGSAEVCDELAADPRVRVLHKPNGGMCSARNYALDRIDSTYVAFCDNDDRYLPHLLRDNLRILHESGADCVYYGRRLAIYDTLASEPRVSEIRPPKYAILRDAEIREHYDVARSVSEAVWACIYRREVIEESRLRFDERLRHGCEDMIFTLEFLRRARAIATNPSCYYVWLRRASHSSSFTITDDFKLGFETAVGLECSLIEDWDVAGRLPDFCADRMSRYLLNPLETALLSGRLSYKATLPLYEWLAGVFEPHAQLFEGRYPVSRKVFCTLLLQRRFRSVHACMLAAQAYLARTKRG